MRDMTPTGNARSTVPNQLRRAAKQSRYVVLDARRVRLDEDSVLRQIRHEMDAHKVIKVVLFITKAGTVMEIRPA